MQKPANPRQKGIVLVLIGAVLWGASGVAAQYLFHEKHFSPEWLVVVRLLLSGLLLLSYDFFKNNGDIFSIWKIRSDCLQLLCFGIFGMLSVQYTYFAAIQHGNAATATILQYLMPAIIVCYFALRHKKKPTAAEGLCLFLAMFGTFLLVTKGDPHNLAISGATLFWGIASAFSAAFYTVQPRKLLHCHRSALVIGWSMLIGGLVMSPVNVPWDFSGTWDLPAFLGLSFVIVFGTVIAFYAYLESIRHIHPAEVSTIASVEPLAAVALSVYFLDVSFGLIDCVGGLCILSTVFILGRSKKQQDSVAMTKKRLTL